MEASQAVVEPAYTMSGELHGASSAVLVAAAAEPFLEASAAVLQQPLAGNSADQLAGYYLQGKTMAAGLQVFVGSCHIPVFPLLLLGMKSLLEGQPYWSHFLHS